MSGIINIKDKDSISAIKIKKIFSTCKIWEIWLLSHPKFKQWFWFIILWLGGLLTVSLLTYPIKLLMRHL